MGKKVINKVTVFLVTFAMLVSPISVVRAEEVNDVPSQNEFLVNSWEGSLEEGNRAYYGGDGQKVTGLQQIGGGTYFFDVDGVLQTGWQIIDGKTYYFDLTSGSRCENKREVIEGVEYDFDANGNAVKTEADQFQDCEEENTVVDPVEDNPVENKEPVKDDKQQLTPEGDVSAQESREESNVPVLKGSKQEFAYSGTRLQTGWQDADDGRKYLDNNGNEVTGFQAIGGRLYYFNSAGILQHGWIIEGDKKYFAAADGVLYKNQFIDFGATQYYMGSDGSVQKGVVKASDGNIYCADLVSGVIRKLAGWVDIGDERYFSDTTGKLYEDQLISFGEVQYYMGSDGSLQKGLFNADNGDLYYADPSTGEIQKSADWIDVGDKKYFSNAAGKLYKNQFISFGEIQYYMGSDGSLQKGFVSGSNGDLYYADPSTGEIRKSADWIDVGDKKYFSDAAGRLYKDQLVSFGEIQYYMGSDGSLQKGLFNAGNGDLYYADPSTGEIQKSADWIDIGDKKYFSSVAGKLYKNQFISFGTTRYYMGSDGSLQKGLVSGSNGDLYYADPSTGEIQDSADWIDIEGRRYFSDAAGKLYKNQFISFGTTQYYMGSDGSVQKGVIKASNGNIYYADSSTGEIQKSADWIDIGDERYFSDAAGKLYKNQFISFGATQYYMGSDGSVQKGVIKASDGNIYYADPSSGVIQKKEGWINVGGVKYFSDAAGKLYKNQFISFGATQYYMGSDGSVQKGVIKASNGDIYYADPSTGEIQKSADWIDIGDERYFSNAAGKLYKNQFISFGATQYYMGSDGSVQKGVIKASDGNIYYADPSSGVIQKKEGWINVGDVKYFSDAAGKLYKNQFVSFGTTQYYMGSDGSVQKEIVTASNGNLYYADPFTGEIQKSAGWIDIGDKRYFSDATGRLYKNQFISFGMTQYYMGGDGSLQKGIVHASNGNSYYTDPISGALKRKAGWVDAGDKRYFSDTAGKLYKNQFISFGNTYYYCGNDAAIVKSSSNYPIAGVLYTFGADGVMKKEAGWGEFNGNKYYKNPVTGFPYKNQWISFGDTTRYYANASGFMVSGWQNIGGKYYYFYPSTKLMARNTTIDGYIIGSDGERVPTVLSKMAARAWGYSSSTPYLILVDRDAHKVGIFTGSQGNWSNIQFWDCGNGAPSTPTKAGVFKVGIRGYYFDSGASRCFWYTQFYGNYLFHTVLCNRDGSIRDGRVGMALSHGCVRLQIPNAKWIYDNIPRDTTVVVY